MEELLSKIPRWNYALYREEGWEPSVYPWFELSLGFAVVVFIWELYLDLRQHHRIGTHGGKIPADLSVLVKDIDARALEAKAKAEAEAAKAPPVETPEPAATALKDIMKLLILLALLFEARVHSDSTCDSGAETCADCMDAGACGWCDGTIFVDGEAIERRCVGINSTFSCDGAFKTEAECDCDTQGAPWDLIDFGRMRGLRIDNSDMIERALAFENMNETLGTVEYVVNGSHFSGTVTSIVGCDRTETCDGNQIFMHFDGENAPEDLQCTYRVSWQDGPDAHTIAMGCNSAGAAPNCFDQGDVLMVFFACLDQGNCPFHAVAPTEVSTTHNNVAAECSAFSSCDACSANDECGWCVGSLYDGGTKSTGVGCFALNDSAVCEGTTLTKSCVAYKCPWYEYYLQDEATVGDCSKLTCSETTGDDPDFSRTNTPAMAYSSLAGCQGNCVDPTVGCSDDSCARTYTCNVSSTCGECLDLDFPRSMRGVELDASYANGIVAMEFAEDYLSAQITSPTGEVSNITIQSFEFDSQTNSYIGEFVIDSTPHFAMMYFATSGALAQNVYLATSPNSQPITWGQGIRYAHNGTEFALLACQYDDNGQPISGLGNSILCAL